MNTYKTYVLKIILMGVIVSSLLTSCGKNNLNDSDDSKKADLIWAWSTDSCCQSGETSEDSAFLEGFASNEKNPDYCPENNSDITRQQMGITITWTNKTTGLNELADQKMVSGCVWFLGCGCYHMFSANIPLVTGENRIRFDAITDDGRYDSASITIRRI